MTRQAQVPLLTAVVTTMVVTICGPAAADPSRALADPRYKFCHDPSVKLDNEARDWCPIVEKPNAACPALPEACARAAEVEPLPDEPNDANGSSGCDGGPKPSDDDDPRGKSGRNKRGAGSGGSKQRGGSEPEPEPVSVRVPASEGMSLFAKVLFVALVAGGIVLLVRALAKHWRWGQSQKLAVPEDAAEEAGAADDVAKGPIDPIEKDVSRLLARAEDAASRGDYTKAVEHAYAALLRRLDGAGIIEMHPARTNGDYVRALRERDDLRQPVREIVRDVERVQFGAEPAAAGIYRSIFDRVVPIATRILTVIAIVIGLGGAAACGGGPKPPVSAPAEGDPSPSGIGAVIGMLRDDGFANVGLRREAITSLDQNEPNVLVVLEGALLDEDEWKTTIAWVKDGGTLIAAGGFSLPEAIKARSMFGGGAEVSLTPVGTLYRLEDLDVRAPHGIVLQMPESKGVYDADAPRAILRRGEAVYAAEQSLGKGRVLVFADRAPFANIALAAGENGAFVSRLLRDITGHSGVIEFADVLTGAGASSPIDSMKRAELLPVILQLLGLVVLFLVWRGAAFGTPRDPPPERRRSFADHVRAVGAGYAKAKASEHAAANFAAWAIERLRERFTRGTRSGMSALAEAIAQRTGRSEPEVLRTLVEAQSARESSGPPSSFRPQGGTWGAPARPHAEPSAAHLQLILDLNDYLRVSERSARKATKAGRSAR